MTERPPQRLLDDPSTGARLRQDLSHARTQSVTYDLEAGLRALTATLDGLTSESAAADVEAASDAEWAERLRSIGAKWWGWAAAGVATVGAVLWVQQQPAARSTQHATSDRAAARVEVAASAAKHAETSPERAAPAPAAPLDTRVEAGGGAARETDPATAVERRAVAARVRNERARTAPAREAARPDQIVLSAAGAQAAARGAQAAAAGAQSVATEAQAAGTGAQVPSSSAAEGASSQPADRVSAQAGAQAPSTPGTLDAAEVEHLARVRRLLAGRPQEALEAARSGQRLFADGLFKEERAGLIVFALARLGRTLEARREADHFLRAYPAGPFAARVREIAVDLERRNP